MNTEEACNGLCADHCPSDKARGSCEVKDCVSVATLEGWYRNLDGMGFRTGINRKLQVCEGHRSVLIGAKKE